MPTTLLPLGVRCNLQCGYCYEDPLREAGNAGGRYDVAKMKSAIEASTSKQEPFLLFGGEALLLPKNVLEDLWSWGFERAGRNLVQTNGVLIDSEHIELFKRYKVNVGISIDGPGALNDARWDRNLEQTRISTARTEKAISNLCENGIPPNLIVTLHRLNATGAALELLLQWFRQLQQLGVRTINAHLLEVENEEARGKYEMTSDECINAVIRIHQERRELPGLAFTLIDDLENLLLGKDSKAKCIWGACDPYTTTAVKGINGQGDRTKCVRVNKEGIAFAPAARVGFERYLSLYQTPQFAGGCKDCRFFLMCRAQCPGTAIDGDWRNKTEHCRTWMRLFESLESQSVKAGKTPLSLSPERQSVEAALFRSWEAGTKITVDAIMRRNLHRKENPAIDETRAIAGPAHVRKLPSPFADRLPFRLKPFHRIAWVSEQARKVWSPRLDEIRRCMIKMDIMSVQRGIRSAALISVLPDESTECLSNCKAAGLSCTLIDQASDPLMRSLHMNESIHEAQKTSLFLVTRGSSQIDFMSAWKGRDYNAVFELLGYPKCCRQHIAEFCLQRYCLDPIWPMAVAESSKNAFDRERDIRGHASSNILLRRIGIRSVPHIPCSFRCHETARIAGALRTLAVNSDPELAEVFFHLDSVMNWPSEWSGLHGIAEVKTPALKICHETDATVEKYAVRWIGNEYPAEGATGLAFPYQRPTRGISLNILKSSGPGLEEIQAASAFALS